MGVARTTIGDVVNPLQWAKNIRLDRYRSELNYAKRMILTLNYDLKNLKSAQALILQKLNRNQQIQDMQSYSSDRFQFKEPKQVISPAGNDTLPGPDPRINWTQNQIIRDHEQMFAERDRIGSEILKITLEIKKQTDKLNETQKTLSELGVDISSQIETDGVTKRLYTESYMLYEVHTQYRALTSDSSGARNFNSDPITLKKVQKLGTLFQAYSERNPYVLNHDLKVDLDDPGSDFNEQSIKLLLDRVRQVYTVKEPYDKRLQHFSDKMSTEVNNAWVAQEVKNERDDSARTPSAELSLSGATSTTAKTVGFLNTSINDVTKKVTNTLSAGAVKVNAFLNKYLTVSMAWDYKQQADAVVKNFGNFISKVNNNTRSCNPSPLTDSDKDKLAKDAADKKAADEAAAAVQKKFEETKKPVDPAVMNAIIKTLYGELLTALADTQGSSTLLSPAEVQKDVLYYSSGGSYSMKVITLDGTVFTAKYYNHMVMIMKAYLYRNYLIKMNISGDLPFDRFSKLLAELKADLYDVDPKFTISK